MLAWLGRRGPVPTDESPRALHGTGKHAKLKEMMKSDTAMHQVRWFGAYDDES